VVEIDGERAFTYFVDADALRRWLKRWSDGSDGGGPGAAGRIV